MRRTLVYLEWKAAWWECRSSIPEFSGAHLEGAGAYAHGQASVCRALKARFNGLWERDEHGSFIRIQREKGGGGRRADEESLFDAIAWQQEQWRSGVLGNAGLVYSVGNVGGDSESDDADEVEDIWEEVEVDTDMSGEEQGGLREGAHDDDEDIDLDLEELAVAGKYAEVHEF